MLRLKTVFYVVFKSVLGIAMNVRDGRLFSFNPLPPSDAVQKQKTFILEDLFSSVLSQFKKDHPSGNLKFKYLGISQSLKLRIFMEKILPISLKLNCTPHTLGCYGLRKRFFCRKNWYATLKWWVRTLIEPSPTCCWKGKHKRER